MTNNPSLPGRIFSPKYARRNNRSVIFYKDVSTLYMYMHLYTFIRRKFTGQLVWPRVFLHDWIDIVGDNSQVTSHGETKSIWTKVYKRISVYTFVAWIIRAKGFWQHFLFKGFAQSSENWWRIDWKPSSATRGGPTNRIEFSELLTVSSSQWIENVWKIFVPYVRGTKPTSVVSRRSVIK